MRANSFHWKTKPPLGSRLDPSHPLSQGLQFFHLYSEGQGLQAFDLSGNGGTGTVTGASVAAEQGMWVPGRNGWALNFNGSNQYDDLGSSFIPNWFPQSNYGISCWFNTSSGSQQGIFGNLKNAGNGYIIYIQSSSVGYTEYGATNSSDATSSASVTVSPNAWHHLVLSCRNLVHTYYLDGNQLTTSYTRWQNETAYSNTLSTRVGNVWLFHFSGRIDSIGVWAGPPPDSEITSLYSDPYQMILPPSIRRFYSIPSNVKVYRPQNMFLMF